MAHTFCVCVGGCVFCRRVGVCGVLCMLYFYLQATASAADLLCSMFGCLEVWMHRCALDGIDLGGFA